MAPEERESGRAVLVGKAAEEEGFGLYSYVLFGSPPTAATRPRYLRTIAAWVEGMEPIRRMEAQFPRAQLNVTYLPVTAEPPPGLAGRPGEAEWFLEHYNYARARALLDVLRGEHRRGPYLVSHQRPLSTIQTLSGHYLLQDLSVAHPDVAAVWMRTFLEQAARTHYWEAGAGEQFALHLQNVLAIAGEEMAPIQKAIAWIK